MSQFTLFQSFTWTVSDLTRYLRELLENDVYLQDLWVQGEVSNLSRPASGHLYFTLKDAAATLRCVMWRTVLLQQPFIPSEGEAVEVHGSISIYEASGQYQLYADLIRPAGEGLLYQEFLRLKAKLEAEGLFEPARKRQIPRFPRCIGIVTSPSGAALQDMLNTIRRRYPIARVVLAPTPVQGEEAPLGIVNALQDLNRLVKPDVILLARGGGSMEDLWAFNDEAVVRAVVASQAPIISGVGHETDFTLTDFAADLRAPTPTAAAELATPNQLELRQNLNEALQRTRRSLEAQLANARLRLHNLTLQLSRRSPLARIRSDRQRLDELQRRALSALLHRLKVQHTRIHGLIQRLHALNPMAILQRGYAIVSQVDGTLVRSVSQVKRGDELKVRVSDGEFEAQVSQSGQ